jgi:hypothetical protein
MKRDPRLRGLSSDHHHALVLARKLSKLAGDWTELDGLALRLRFEQELEPHFRIEEEILVPALRAAGRGDLADQTVSEHAALRSIVVAPEGIDARTAADFGALLSSHVRFEETTLFPVCETLLSSAILDLAQRAHSALQGGTAR